MGMMLLMFAFVCVCARLYVYMCVFVCGTLLVVEAMYRLSCDLLLVKEDLQLRSLCLCLHSRQFLTATQHTDGQTIKDGKLVSIMFWMGKEKKKESCILNLFVLWCFSSFVQ